MANTDKDTALPVRSEADGTDERVHVKIYDGTTNPSLNATEVDDDNNLHVEVHGNDPSGADKVLRLSEGSGALTPDGVYDGTGNTNPGNVGLITSDRATNPGDSTQKFRLTGVQGTADDAVHALDVALHDEEGNAYSVTNPIPVAVTTLETGDEIVIFSKSLTDLVRHATETHDYTVSASHALKLNKVMVSASGKIKAELKLAGSVVAVKFNSTAEPNIEFEFPKLVTVAAAAKVEINITNNDYQAFTAYSTIIGTEVTVP